MKMRLSGGRTPYFWRRSLDSAADMIFLRTLEGAEKCALRHFLREADTAVLNFMATE